MKGCGIRLGVLLGLTVSLVACAADGTPRSVIAPTSGTEQHVPGMATGRAKMHPMNQSGVKGVITFTDDGNTLTVTGTATGLLPGGVYGSLIYDNGSVPGGPEALACEPTIFDPTDPDFILPTMFVGFWAVDAGGNGTLNAVNTNGGADYVPLSKFKTISIRQFDPPLPDSLVACGEEATHKAGK